MWSVVLPLAAALALVAGHGTVVQPPARGSREVAKSWEKIDYDLVGSNCGGITRQHKINGGKCGICGDPYNSPLPRKHERGGKFDSGIITTTYEAGSVIPIIVKITAHHRGYWEFKLCPDSHSIEQHCFDAHPVELQEGGTKFYPLKGSTTYVVHYRLPEDLTCENCVLQWKYTAGNNWGFCNNGTGRLGCGFQETFGACSDIAITGGSGRSSGSSPAHNNKIPPGDSFLLNKLGKKKFLPKHKKQFW